MLAVDDQQLEQTILFAFQSNVATVISKQVAEKDDFEWDFKLRSCRSKLSSIEPSLLSDYATKEQQEEVTAR